MKVLGFGVILLSWDTGKFAHSYSVDAVNDKIGQLPGAENLDVNFNQFSGYLPVQGKGSQGEKTKNLHYWFVESASSPSTDPIAFWTNGGPGLIAFFTEQGPFRPNSDGTLSLNQFAWNKNSNMVFIESPTGVGFSYSDLREDLKSNDRSTSIDNYNLIQAFYERFPEYLANSMYLTSESYGGHYIPTLAKVIVDENKSPTTMKPILNLKGIAIGNPYTDTYSGTPAMVETLWGHQLISWPLYNYYKSECAVSSRSWKCSDLENQAIDSIGNLNPYALDFSICSTPTPPTARSNHLSEKIQNNLKDRKSTVPSRLSKSRGEQKLWLLHHLYRHLSVTHTEEEGEGNRESRILALPSIMGYQPCEDDWTVQYLKSTAVKMAMHVKEDIVWQACSNIVEYDYQDMDNSTAPIYNYLIDGKYDLDILIYSGDDDSVCGTIGSQKWIWDLGYPALSTWETYQYKGQTAGYLTQFKTSNFAFLTIHGAGHEVPTYQPEVAFDMWGKFLAGKFTR